MKIPFYILGLLIRYGPQHGYKLKQIIEERISDFAKIKLPTIYYHLQKLKEQGYITEIPDNDGNRHEKFVYEITEIGIKHYEQLLIKQLKEDYSPEFELDGVLYFKESADKDILLKELEFKKKVLIDKLKSLEIRKSNTLENIPDIGRCSANLIFEHHQCHYEAELIWLEKVIVGLSK